MANYIWTGLDAGASGNDKFTSGFNWDFTTPPGSTDIAEFSTTFGTTETVDGDNATTGQLLVDSGNTLTLDGNLTTAGVFDGTAGAPIGGSINGTLTINAGATLMDHSSEFEVGYTSSGSMTVNGEFTASGLLVGLGGPSTLMISDAGSNVTVSRALQIDSAGIVSVTNQGSLSGKITFAGGALYVDDTASLSGLLDVEGIGGVIEAVSTSGGSAGQVVDLSNSISNVGSLSLSSDGIATLDVTGSVQGGVGDTVSITTGRVDLGQAQLYGSYASLTVGSDGALLFGAGARTTDSLSNVRAFTNNGQVLVSGGMAVSNVKASNLSGGTLSGGKWTVTGTGSSLNLSGSAITTLGAVVVLGNGSTFETTDSDGTTTTLEDSLTTVASGGQLVINGGTFASTTSAGIEVQSGGILQVTNGGTLSSSGSFPFGSPLTLDSGSKFGGSGTVTMEIVANRGSTISASAAGTLTFVGFGNTFGGVLGGPGTIDIEGFGNTIEAGTSLKSGGLILGAAFINLQGNLSYAGKLTLSSSSDLDLVGNKFNASKATTTLSSTTVEDGTLYLGNGSVNGTVSLQTTLVESGALNLASGADLNVMGLVTGAGTIAGGGNSTIELGTVGQPAVSVSGATHFSLTTGDTLQLDNATLFRGIVSGFDTGANATIDVRSVATGAAEKLALVDNHNGTETLKVSNGTSHAALTLDGQFVAAGFNLASDSNGGTAITYAAPPPTGLAVAHA